MPTTTERRGPLAALKRLAWFLGLWAAGVLTVGAVAGALHWLMRAL